MVTDFAVQDDGAIVLAGTTFNATGDDLAVAFLTRIAEGGTLDPTFGSGGHVLAPFAELVSTVTLSDSGIYLAGRSIVDGNARPMVARFQSDGVLDPSFGEAGVASPSLGETTGSVSKLELLPDGSSVGMANLRLSGVSGMRTSFFRATGEGALDPSFGKEGVSVLESIPTFSASDMVVQPNGRIVATGPQLNERGYSDLAVVRICP
jgi:uncharacterized delta-60 repeat protein